MVDLNVLAIGVAFLVALVWARLAISLGPIVGWVDRPEADTELKVHERPAVPLGGVGIFLAVHIAMAMSDRFDPGLLAATGIVLVLGLVDDRVGLSPKLRLLIEVAAGVVLVVAADVDVHGWFGILIGTALVVFAINAINLYDGLDGLVGSTALVTALGLAALAYVRTIERFWFYRDLPKDFWISLDSLFGIILAFALFGFLILNWHPAKVFLGDNGAYAVALFISYGILRSELGLAPDVSWVIGGSSFPGVWIAMGLLGVFALDLIVTFARRRLNGKPLFEGDRSHVYDQLRDRGMSIKRVALTSAALQAFLVIVTIVVDRLLGGWSAAGVLVLVALGLLVVARARGFLAKTD